MEGERRSGVVLRSMRSLGTGTTREVAKEALARRVVDIERNFIVCCFRGRCERAGIEVFVVDLICFKLTGTKYVVTV